MSKKVTFTPRPNRDPAQQWVEERSVTQPKRPTKRLTFDIDAELHRKMRRRCVEEGLSMSEEIRRLIESRFGE